MKLTLYHYVHCPFCVRVRMTLGHLGLSYQSKVLPYDDEKTPVSFTGKKMLPIMEIDGRYMNESLDIIRTLDHDHRIKWPSGNELAELEQVLKSLGDDVHSLAMPYWIYTPEFDQSSRVYFQHKKEEKRGPFKELVRNQSTFIKSLNEKLAKLESEIKPFYQSQTFTLKDILLASHLWGLYVVPEFQFSPKVHGYLQSVRALCRFNYHQDFWS
jgi:glutaredoxin 2